MSHDVLDCEPVDFFSGEVDSLVLSIYDATISGISELNRSAHQGFQTAKWSHPDEKAQELAWWDEQIAVLQYHAGGVGLVSLIMLFEQWLKRFHAMGEARNILPKSSKKSQEPSTKERFLNIENILGTGPLSFDRVQKLLTARNSIVQITNLHSDSFTSTKPMGFHICAGYFLTGCNAFGIVINHSAGHVPNF